MDKFFSLSNQFKYCPNAFRIDTYEGCNFGCKYCFANNRNGAFSNKRKNEVIDYNYMKRFSTKHLKKKEHIKTLQ